uniref:patatin-like phospholipase family protein n=1 Tax=Muricoccus harenae TaxID=2692566 RepID=UPI001331B435
MPRNDTPTSPARDTPGGRRLRPPTRIALVLQGGGALGSYQAGVYEALARHGLEPDRVAGVSIGGINAALIAGNPPERRVERLRTFWERASSGLMPPPRMPTLMLGDGVRTTLNQLSAAMVAIFGVPGFFQPRLLGPPLAAPGSPAALSFYDTAPLRETLLSLVDFDRINDGKVRLSVGAVNILTGNNVVFDSSRTTIRPEHIMASGALPPGFPPVNIEGEPYWDGGLVSNTPLEFVLDEEGVNDLVIFQVDLFNARGPMPRNLMEADERETDIRYSSRTRLNTDAHLRLHAAKAAVRRLIRALPPELSDSEDVRLLRDMAQENAVTVVQLIYRKRPYEGGSKDYEFSRQTMMEHWACGVADVERYMARHGSRPALPPDGGVMVIDPGHED